MQSNGLAQLTGQLKTLAENSDRLEAGIIELSGVGC
jgi:X-X-X-Leu-X-X-Gly heptad repeat protein